MSKKLIVYTLGFVAAFFILDWAFGLTMDYLLTQSKGGDTQNLYHINNECSESILIFGSSRANHHYVSSDLQDSLGMTVYNCGIDGNGIVLAYCFLNNILESGYKPEVIVYDFFPDFDLKDNKDLTHGIARLRPYKKAAAVKDLIARIDKTELLKLKLSSYRYNSVFTQVIGDVIKPQQTVENGYKPIYDSMTQDFAKDSQTPYQIDSIKVKCLRDFVRLCDENNIRLIFTVSPNYEESLHNIDYGSLLSGILGNSAFDFIDIRNVRKFIGKKSFFSDPIHMNDKGAIAYSALLADSLKARGIFKRKSLN